jgi:predicted enzyme related to lactoylglutathione lyase
MEIAGTRTVGRFCWVDLAADDAASAKAFYGALFGWTAHDRPANGGVFTCLRLAGRDVGSLYQLDQGHLDRGVPSHWTPYVRVADVEQVVARAAALGGAVIVSPFVVDGMARIALIVDRVGAPVGLWQALEAPMREDAHG